MLSRRCFLLCTLSLFTTSSVSKGLVSPDNFFSHESIKLWPEGWLGRDGPSKSIHISKRGVLTGIKTPSLEVFKPVTYNGKAVFISAGGGYSNIQVGNEVIPVVNLFLSQGYMCYVLLYRLPVEGWALGGVASLQDAQRGLSIVKSREKNISAIGFSAGAHLLGMALNKEIAYEEGLVSHDNIGRVRNVTFLYPVVSLEKPYNKTLTHHNIVGDAASPVDEEKWSLHENINEKTPPSLIVHAKNDKVVSYENSVLLYDSCKERDIESELMLLQKGGHGFGIGRKKDGTDTWIEKHKEWVSKYS